MQACFGVHFNIFNKRPNWDLCSPVRFFILYFHNDEIVAHKSTPIVLKAKKMLSDGS